MKLSIIVTDSGPLITLAVAKSLDTLLLPGLPVLIPDMVRLEVIRHRGKPGASEVADWILEKSTSGVDVPSTEIFDEYMTLLISRPETKSRNRGEQAAAEVLAKELQGKNHGAILLFEESSVAKQNFLIRLPDEVVVLSTSEFLEGLEFKHLIPSASAILDRAVGIRGEGIRKSFSNLISK